MKENFGITSELSNWVFFMATYNNDFSKPLKCPERWNESYTFCSKVVEQGNDQLLFLASNTVADKVILKENTEAYGMGGGDHFEVTYNDNAAGVIKINGGEGSDTISTIGGRRAVETERTISLVGDLKRIPLEVGLGKTLLR